MRQGRIVIVTGAAAGIGLATARAFAAAGDTVVLADIAADQVRERAAELGEGHVSMALDVGDEGAVIRTVAEIAARFGRIDVLVNNAGIVDPEAGLILDRSLADIRRLTRVNLDGSFLMAREAGRAMLAVGSGSIVNLSSGAALGALPGRTPYSMTKGAVLGLTRSLAREWRRRGVRVNAVLPGYVRTEIIASLARAGRIDTAAAGLAVPLGRMAEPDEIAAVIAHVAAARGLNGAALLADGGYDAFGARGPAASRAVSGTAPDGAVVVVGGAQGVGAAIADRFAAAGRRVVVLDDADPLDEDAMTRAMAGVGRIAVLVHAVVAGPDGGDGLADVRHAFDRHVMAPLVAAKAAVPAMAAAGGGSIVTLSPGEAMATADSAIVTLTRSLACEWAGQNIRVNAVRFAPDGQGADVADAVAILASDAASYVTGITYPM